MNGIKRLNSFIKILSLTLILFMLGDVIYDPFMFQSNNLVNSVTPINLKSIIILKSSDFVPA